MAFAARQFVEHAWAKMTRPLRKIRNILLPKSAAFKAVSLFVLICAVPLLVTVGRYLVNLSWGVEVSFRGTLGNTSKFVVHNSGRSEQLVRIAHFVVSTARFGKLDWDEFETRTMDAGRVVSAEAIIEFSVDVPADTGEFMCSSLRAIGFFRDYGTLAKGSLTPDGEPASQRANKIVDDLSCSFDVRDYARGDAGRRTGSNSPPKQKIRVPCGQVSWISGCIAQVVAPGE